MQVRFIKSSSSVDECPQSKFPEFAFIGRSNVGKSSLINMLANTKELAKTSSKPGKTRLINHFLITHKTNLNNKSVEKNWYLVDLPGYGYANASKSEKLKFEKLIYDYILKSPNLVCLFLLIDSRLEPQKNDLLFTEFLGQNKVPFVITFTKSDKLSSSKLSSNINLFKKTLLEQWESLPEIFITSSKTGKGREEILTFILNTIKLFENQNK